jgi:hypothetical protein
VVFRAYLSDQSVDHLASTLKKGGIKDLLLFFPVNKQESKCLEEHFKAADLPQVSEWWIKRQSAILKDDMIKELKEMCEREDDAEQASPGACNIHNGLTWRYRSLPLSKLARRHFLSLRRSLFRLSGRVSWPLLIGVLVPIRSRVLLCAKLLYAFLITQYHSHSRSWTQKYAPILEAFCTNAKTEVALINVVQVYCYEDTRIIKAFPQILKVSLFHIFGGPHGTETECWLS